MALIIDITQISSSPYAFGWWFMKTIGWIYPVCLFCYGMILAWLNYVRNQYRAQRRYVMLAIDVPKNNEQGPKAVEHIFNHLAGAHQQPPFGSRWWEGEIPDTFSFELVCIGGYTQFIIHTVAKYRDLIEAIIYAQYPNAEITEIEDYAKPWNIKFPHEKYELWGADIKLSNKDVFPIRSYRDFEDTLSGEYKDTMASMIEGLSRIGPHEQVWIQFLLTPADNDWGKKADPIVAKIAGKPFSAKKNIGDRVFELGNTAANFVGDVFSPPTEGTSKGESKKEASLMQHLTPGEKSTIESIETKTSKIGFHTKVRMLYIAEKPYFRKGFGVNVVYGGLKQFNSTSNGFKPDKKTYVGGVRFFKQLRLNARKNDMLRRYKSRGHWLEPGSYGYLLNSEELATVYHFPTIAVMAPQIKMSEGKKAEPPISLPVERPELFQTPGSTPKKENPAPVATAPDNLPFVEEE